jgi:hypothetical protein
MHSWINWLTGLALTHLQFRVLFILLSHKNTDDVAFPSRELLARKIKGTSERSIVRTLHQLARLGRRHRAGDGASAGKGVATLSGQRLAHLLGADPVPCRAAA